MDPKKVNWAETNRRRFVCWIERELEKDGVLLTQPVRYDDMRREVERHWLEPLRAYRQRDSAHGG